MNHRPLVALLALGGLAAAVPAQGQDAKPTPCVGLAAQDPAGDQKIGFAGNFTPVPADASVDLTEMFFRSVNGKVTMNFTVADAKATNPPGTAGSGVRVLYSNPADLYLDVRISPTAVTYRYGHFEDTGPVSDGETTGKIFEGPNGVISVDLPPSHGGKTGMKLGGTAFSFYTTGAVLASTDFIPDDPGTWKYNGATCGDAGAPPSTPGSPSDPAPVAPGGGGSGPSTAPQPGSPQTVASGDLAITASPRSLKAKKVKKSVTFTLTSQEDVTNLTAALKKGSKTVGSGKLAKVEKGKSKLKLKIKKKLKKGTYQLVLNGRKSDGSNGAAFLKLKVK